MASAADPAALHRSADSSRSAPGNATSATDAPSLASWSAVARPMPELAPVTRATRLVKRCMVMIIQRGGLAGTTSWSGLLARRRFERVVLSAGELDRLLPQSLRHGFVACRL